MTRQSRLLCNALDYNTAASNYQGLFAALYQASVKITGLESYGGGADDNPRVTAYDILNVLYSRGKIAYDKDTKLWLKFYGVGATKLYGSYKQYRLIGANNLNITRNADDVVIFKANPQGLPLEPLLATKCALLANFDVAIPQNLNAIKRSALVITDDELVAEKIAQVERERLAGKSFIGVKRKIAQAFEERLLTTPETPYLVDRLLSERRTVFFSALNLVGVRTPIGKDERLLADEVSQQNAASDCFVSMLVKSINATAESNSMTIRAEYSPLREDAVAAITGGDGLDVI